MDQTTNSMDSANRPSPHISELGNETPIPAMAAPASPCGVVDTGPDIVVQNQRRSSRQRARLQRFPTADALKVIPGQMSPKVRGELPRDLMTPRLHERETLGSGNNRVAYGLIEGRNKGTVALYKDALYFFLLSTIISAVAGRLSAFFSAEAKTWLPQI